MVVGATSLLLPFPRLEISKPISFYSFSFFFTPPEADKFKREALAEFESFKKRATEKEKELKEEHARAVLDLSRDVIQAKRDFEKEVL